MDEDMVPHSKSTLGLAGERQDGAQAVAPESIGGMEPRPYQLEMFDASLNSNIVVTRLWFLAPTVSLCQQQHDVIRSQMPAIEVRFLSGADNVDRWRDQSIWDAVLKNVRVVVSTHQVLYDALMHGFVQLGKLALLVFDEAHHCVESHPANRIMQDFYHPALRRDGKEGVPHILGISASPIVNSKPRGLQIIEENLNALCKTPRIHREELMRYVHPPVLKKLIYPAPPDTHSQTLESLLAVYRELDILQDPYVLSLKAENTARSAETLKGTLLKRKTYCQDQFKGICNKAIHICREFGAWATNYYIAHSIDKLRSKATTDITPGWNDGERHYLLNALDRVKVAQIWADSLNDTGEVSPKLESFINLLVEESVPDFAGLVFIEQRVAAAVLSHLLSVHPRTKDLFECATFVGTSAGVYRKAASIGELIEPRGQKTTLDDFRNGRKNLIIATSVLEEGIDISACHLVMCFSRPPNLKSFVQRRGRARARQSKFVLMLAENDKKNAVDRWQELEEEMKSMYLDDQRKLKEIERTESMTEEGDRRFLVESTGALLTLETALTHLYHFCDVLPRTQYVDLRPAFSITENPTTQEISAVVTLPSCVDPSVRRRAGIGKWRTERMAKKDAAFEMYIGLYEAGLVNDNLLPLKHDAGGTAEMAGEKRVSMVSIPEQLNPWILLARKWSETSEMYTSIVEVTDSDNGKLQMELLLPSCPPLVPEFTLYWNENVRFRVSISPSSRVTPMSTPECEAMRKTTEVLLRAIFWGRMKPNEMDFPALFAPRGGVSDLDYWTGIREATEIFASHPFSHRYGLVRDKACSYKAHIFKEWTIEAPPLMDISDQGRKQGSPGSLFVRVGRLTKRRDFLHAINAPAKDPTPSLDEPHESSKSELLLAEDCAIDNLPFIYSRFSLFIPSILHRIGVSIVADELRKTILAPVGIRDLSLVITAISASSAREGTNYQRLEFFGDSLLKLCTSVQLVAEYPNWHEGYLSGKKDRVVANSRLTRATISTGLHKYILSKAFTGLKWKPLYVSDLLAEQEDNARRILSTKVLADVVESLLAAAFMDGGSDIELGFEKAIKCLKAFFSEIVWQTRKRSNDLLYDAATLGVPTPAYFDDLERLIGYKFTKKGILVEAMTHPSFEAQPHRASYQRLEFLGDSILDYIVVNNIFRHHPELSHDQMHLARTALVNADFLAFLCMEFAIELDITDIKEDQDTEVFHKVEKKVPKQIWKFMRHHSPDITRAQDACVRRHVRLRDEVWHALTSERGYPWAKLRRIGANKFFSDIIESIIGAIYVDSHGDFSACEVLMERIGILKYLRRIVEGDGDNRVRLLHPKEWLGQLADKDRVRYVLGLETDEDEGEDSSDAPPRKKRHVCRVLIKDQEVAVVGDGASREEVQTKAAEAAIGILLGRKGLGVPDGYGR
ncbi:hypothetical protein FGG08_001786 [Glutinoglossum americanum]|uniref:Dicer-like protein 2 n=1 Tax=Glutinoglossum americanum TaxID=1670608 RepID=A0A9P8I7G7_9PEZI|nr:hypothetical protein FGG08_001786 [Glutinoglossum americanum]